MFNNFKPLVGTRSGESPYHMIYVHLFTGHDYVQGQCIPNPKSFNVRCCNYSGSRRLALPEFHETINDLTAGCSVKRKITRISRIRAVQYTDRAYPTEKLWGPVSKTLCQRCAQWSQGLDALLDLNSICPTKGQIRVDGLALPGPEDSCEIYKRALYLRVMDRLASGSICAGRYRRRQ